MTKFMRRISVVAALLLSLSLIVPAQAIENGSFGTAPTCTTSGWTTVGDVTTLTESQAGLSASSNCVARIHAGMTTIRSSKISQTLTVPEEHLSLEFDILASADLPSIEDGATQTITLRAADRSVLYTKSRNTAGPYTFAYPTGPIAGIQITLEISTYVTTLTTRDSASSTATLYIDNVRFVDEHKPEPGIGAW